MKLSSRSVSYIISNMMLQNYNTYDECYTKGNVSQEVGDQGTHPVVETEVIDEIETQTAVHIVYLLSAISVHNRMTS